MDFEINIDFLTSYKAKKELTKEDFKGNESLFSIFNTDGDNVLSASEINNIFQQIINSSETNKDDLRSNQYSLFDQKEAEHFISNNKNNQGELYKDLGITISQVFDFLKTLMNNAKSPEDAEIYNGFVKVKEADEQIDVQKIDSAILEKSKIFENIPQRKEQQFSEKERIQLAKLSDEEIEQAKNLLFVKDRIKQFSAEDIINLVTECGGKFNVNKENYNRFQELLSSKNAANEELSGEDVIRLMTLSSDKIDKAIELLKLENRADNPLTVSEIVKILNCDSDELLNAIIMNPNLQNIENIKTQSQYWLSVKDNSSNITYRYIKGQKYPEEISDEKIDGDKIQRTIYNRNLNIKQFMIFENDNSNNPIIIKTQHLSSKGKIEYTEVVEQGNNIETPDVYTIDSEGNKKYLQQTILDETNGTKKVIKNFKDDRGNLTQFSYTISSNKEYQLSYTVVDGKGNKFFEREIKLTKTGDNFYEYKKDNEVYQIETHSDRLIITNKSDNVVYTINYSDYISEDDNPEMFKQNIFNIPADILIFLSKNPLTMSYGTKTSDNQGFCRADKRAVDIGNITKTKSQTELNAAFITILIHELGHYIDNPNLSEENGDILSMNEDFIKIYKEELDKFNKNHSTEEQMIMLQFNGIGYQSKTKEVQLKRTLSEVFAESNMVSHTNSKNWTSARSYYLQRYFPRTIAKAQELLGLRINS